MARRNRSTLKNYFKRGARPSQTEFHDLVDSCLNMNDDGFEKSPENGVEIASADDHEGLLGFFRNRETLNAPLWSFRFDRDSDNLLVVHREFGTVLALCPDGRIGVSRRETPIAELDVNGVIAASGRTGTYSRGFIPADGMWRNITEGLEGCHAFEVIAGAGGRRRDGRYAVLHAVAVNAYNPTGFLFNFLNRKKRIRCTQSFYRSGADKLKLRWHEQDGKYYLQAKTNSPYGPISKAGEEEQDYPYQIHYSITRLWFDDTMEECRFQSSKNIS